jgi:DNA-directed RNA polymerase subunit M
MKFCPSCGTKLVLARGTQDANTDLDHRCPQCGYAEGRSPIPKGSTETDTQEAVVILDEGQELRTTSTAKAGCPKCPNNLAYVWQVQTRSGDEGATQFFRCTECGHTWRLYT